MRLRRNYKIQLLVLGTILFGLWFFLPKTPRIYNHEFLVFGTKVSLEMTDIEPEIAEQAIEQLGLEFDAFHRRWHAWERGGLLHKINQAIADGRSIVLEPAIIKFLKLCQKLSAQSGYRFNPAIGQLVKLWGFHDNPKTSAPDKNAVAFLTQPPLNLDALIFDGNQLSASDPRIKIDLGAIAKGYAIDLAIDSLKTLGIRHAIVNAGGDLRAMGQKHGWPWQIGIRHPDGSIIGKIDIGDDEAVVSSGDYERHYTIKKHRVHHIINPHTGRPTDSIRAVTLIADKATKADAAATAILVAGIHDWQKVATQMGVAQVLVVDKSGQVHMSEPMKKRVALRKRESLKK